MTTISLESLTKGSDKPNLSKCEILNLANECIFIYILDNKIS